MALLGYKCSKYAKKFRGAFGAALAPTGLALRARAEEKRQEWALRVKHLVPALGLALRARRY